MKTRVLALAAVCCALGGLGAAPPAFSAPFSARIEKNCDMIATVASIADSMRAAKKTYMDYVKNVSDNMARQPALRPLQRGFQRAGLLVFVGNRATPDQSRQAIRRMCLQDPDYFSAR